MQESRVKGVTKVPEEAQCGVLLTSLQVTGLDEGDTEPEVQEAAEEVTFITVVV